MVLVGRMLKLTVAGSDQQTKQTKKGANQASLLSVESDQDPKSKKITEAKDGWVKIRLTMESGAAGRVTPEGMFPCVKLHRKTSLKKFVAANGEQISELGKKTIPVKTHEGI